MNAFKKTLSRSEGCCVIANVQRKFVTTNTKTSDTIKINDSSNNSSNTNDDLKLQKLFKTVSTGSPPRAKLNSIINVLLYSNILSTMLWSKVDILNELYNRRIDKKLNFHLNVLYGLGSKGINFNKKGIVNPVLFYPLLDYDQFRCIVQVMQVADKEKKYKIHEEHESLEKLFKK
ncbi:conserved protein, unknown function [Hepatocystis sp. ex Piliocolobus tephrosceles]|nr:conserved protein, unknown function [Hepatocystis sp. ex Piliocolobus tephrosceles]